jgi:SAM-dependent methyltransferase
MSDWTAGYVAEIGYTYGYYTELNPLRVKLAFLNAGLAVPEQGTACDLGFGQGISVNLHASASLTRWYGTDFNPSQAGFAQSVARTADNGAQLFDESFEQFCSRPDLPDFDYIGLHGIWSWIDQANWKILIDFLRRKLKVGGVLYISYNTQPGWAAFAPVRDLMLTHKDVMGAPGAPIVSRLDGALDFVQKLFATEPTYLKANPAMAGRLEALKSQDRHYLVHEYFNRNWTPTSFAQMASLLEPAKLDFACSANYGDHVHAINLTPPQRKFLEEIPDPMFRESVRDFMVNQQFRKDYWVKGARKLNPLERAEALRAVRVVLVMPRSEVKLKVTGALGECAMQEAVYAPILDLLASHKPVTMGQLEQAVAPKGISTSGVMEALMLLTASGALLAAQDDEVIAEAAPRAARLNAVLMERARGSADVHYLASPVTGGGVVVPRIQQIFLRAISQGKKSPREWAQVAWADLAAQGQSLIVENRTLQTVEENMQELTRQAQDFNDKHLSMLRSLQVI